MTFAEPPAALAALAGVVPVGVAVLRLRAARRARRALGLREPRLLRQLVRPVLLVCLFGLLGAAAARPDVRRERERTTRTDVQVIVALDSSRSMLAASRRGTPERWQRARAFAHRLQAELPGVPIGLSSLTNRLLPYLFPTSDPRAYDLVLDEAYGIERPPPGLTLDHWVTVFEPLNGVVHHRFFSAGVHNRVLVVLSDVEAHPFDARVLLRNLERSGTTPVVVRFWHAGERIFRPGAQGYRASQPDALGALRRDGWPAFSETQLTAAAAFVRRTVGTGPVARIGYRRDDLHLAPFLAAAALLPLLLLVAPGGLLPARRLRSGPRPAVTLSAAGGGSEDGRGASRNRFHERARGAQRADGRSRYQQRREGP